MKNIYGQLAGILKIAGASSLALLTFYAINASASSAWTAAPSNPPAGNVAGPLSTGFGTQTKSGGDINLAAGGSLYAGGVVAAPSITSTGQVTSPKYCIGSSCITAWPGTSSINVNQVSGSIVAGCGASGGSFTGGVNCWGGATGNRWGTSYICPSGTQQYGYVYNSGSGADPNWVGFMACVRY